VHESFLADLKVAIEKRDMANSRVPSKSYKPSSMKCIRNMYFQMVGAEQDAERTNYCLVGICESGTDRHERIQDIVCHMKDYGIDCEYINVAQYVTENNLTDLEIVEQKGFETKLFNKRYGISFMCDGIIRYKGQYYILEIKTESVYKWQMRSGVAEEHISQGTAYSVSFGIDKVMFVYENRDNCDKKAYLLDVTSDMKMDLVGKIELCDRYVAELQPPPKPLDLAKKVCTYCSYKTECKKAGS
jgi:hypothetical protein